MFLEQWWKMPTSSFFLEQLIHKPILRNLPYDDENPSKVAIGPGPTRDS